ncbi:helix-turn-helix domain-containing protein [Variovorax guangxiensis]|uniref:Winged helix-turn-helix domain-containing protein n=1 Tax=Variovorax guangxiensis TaxID=1775474 RepID=A0A840FTU2_9BURK|nr:helix-turn-helix domain-containing protein [Variovorax guangxiensis]MBB4226016.1 hypothetical protein [Variovorax guangxiensis]
MKKSRALEAAQRDFGSQAGMPDFTAPSARRVNSLKLQPAKVLSQMDRVLAALRRGPKTSDELRSLGIYMPSTRIFYLREQGYAIRTDLVAAFTNDGYSHNRLARYTLAEPASDWRTDTARGQ